MWEWGPDAVGVDGADGHTHGGFVNTPESHALKWLGGWILLYVVFYYNSIKWFFFFLKRNNKINNSGPERLKT